jgi:hypothetical protein
MMIYIVLYASIIRLYVQKICPQGLASYFSDPVRILLEMCMDRLAVKFHEKA